jgi:hypothetical protein
MTTPAIQTEPKAEATPAPDAIVLEQPIKREAGDVTRITLRKPLAGELRGIKVGDLINGDVSSVLAVLPRSSPNRKPPSSIPPTSPRLRAASPVFF